MGSLALAPDGKVYPATIKQEAFAHAYVETGNASEAYRRAYDAENMSADCLHVQACELLQNSKVSVIVNSLKEELRRNSAVTIDSLSKQLESARLQAEELSNPSAQVSAITMVAKLHGLLVDKKQEVSQSRLDMLSDEELDRLIEATADKGAQSDK